MIRDFGIFIDYAHDCLILEKEGVKITVLKDELGILLDAATALVTEKLGRKLPPPETTAEMLAREAANGEKTREEMTRGQRPRPPMQRKRRRAQ